jgi:hypothetical protein
MGEFKQLIKDLLFFAKLGDYRPLIMVLLLALFVILGIWWGVYQFNLCYPEISDSVLYCLQHAF